MSTKIKGEFERIPPSEKTEPLVLGWFAISHRWMSEKQIRRNAYGTVYKIKSEHGVIYRNLRFSPRLKGSSAKSEGQMLIDWQGWITLCDIDCENTKVEIEIKKANALEMFYHSITHPDPSYRHSMAVARVGLYISVISLILAFK
jgi:hypothetical protein